MWKEFKSFVMRGNVIDLAVGVIIGGAFGKIVSSLVNDVIMPIVSLALGQISFTDRFISLDGVEYDSLTDLVAFGVAPAALAFSWAMAPTGRFGWLAACLYIACGALRLARFNVQSTKKRSTHFSGLPIPAAAGLIVSIVLFGGEMGWAQGPPRGVLIGVLYLLSFLMVSNIKFSSFKELELRKRKPFPVLVGIIVLLVLIVNEPQIVLFSIALLYLLHGPVRTCMLWRKKRSSQNTENREIADQTEQGTVSNKE